MKLYNTLSRSVEDIVPFQPGNLGMYACGPTVYDYIHLGHLRRYVMDDVLIRALKHAGFSVKQVQNITDVGHLVSDADEGEDKMEKGARKYNKTVWEIAKEFENHYWKSMDLMGVGKPDISCRATDHIPEQIALIQRLEKNGFVYVIDDGVYFDTSKLSDYGKLAHLDLEHIKAGARVDMVAGKKHPTDFALWKFSPKDQKRQMEWDSPWGKGFPGWHIECSAMSMKYLGDQFDLHTGGIDHIPVHHTNEIAQSEAATGKVPFVKYWVHHNFLRVEDGKMSKSLGNVYSIDEIVKRGFSPMALRLLFLGSHYRSELNFTWDNLKASQVAYDRLIALATTFKKEKERTALSQEKLQKIEEYRHQFYDHLENDLHTPEALSIMWEVTKSNIPGQDKYDLLVEFDEILGLQIAQHVTKRETQPVQSVPKNITELAEQRKALRDAKKFSESDAVRTQVESAGWHIVDNPDGTYTVVAAPA